MTARATSLGPWQTFAVVSGATVVGSLNFAAVFVAFDEIARDFDTPRTSLSWALTAFSITVAALMVPAGWLADRVGRTQVFLAGVSLFTVGSLLVALAPGVGPLVAARVIQATGLALESPAALALVLHAFPAEQRATAVGATGAIGGIGAALAPVAGGALIDAVGWRWTFAANVPVGVATVLIGWRLLPRQRPEQERATPDLLGAAGLVVGIGALALAIVQSNAWGFSSPTAIGALLIGLGVTMSVVARSATHPAPILELSLYRVRNFARGNLLGLLIAGNFGATYLAFITFLTSTWELELVEAGLAVAFIPLIGGPLSFAAGRLADQFGHRNVIVPGCAFMAAGGLWFLLNLTDERAITTVWLPGAALYAIGVGLAHAASTASAVQFVPATRLGSGGATNRIAQEIGTTLAVAIVVVMLDRSGTADVTAIRRVMLLLIVVSVIGGALATGLRNPKPEAPARGEAGRY